MSTAVPLYAGGENEALVEQGILGPDDRVELLEGVIVTVSPQSPRHAAVVRFLEEALRAAIGGEAEIRSQMPLRAGSLSSSKARATDSWTEPRRWCPTGPLTAQFSTGGNRAFFSRR